LARSRPAAPQHREVVLGDGCCAMTCALDVRFKGLVRFRKNRASFSATGQKPDWLCYYRVKTS